MLRPALLLTLLAALAAGCGESEIDATEVEQEIERQLSSATAKVASVSCPDGVEHEDGQRFECDVRLEGGGDATVVVTEEDGDEFAYEVKPGSMRIAGDSVESYLEGRLAATGVSADVSCADSITVIAGQTVECDAVTAGGRNATLTFTWADDAGTVAPDSIETG
ncbi:MAG: DUF4333 domain-containing protein [Thermoleophilaceae bacterium]|nr:DUF4333 domain-containing protein [Thermoleophilaceae bacterium]